MSSYKPAPLSGFPELLPNERFVELQVIDQLRTTFELHGFAPIETRAAEPLELMLRKGEIDKEVYVLRRLHGAPDEGASADGEWAADTLGLHFDLTVPFARYVLENAGKLDFPFRRYQIQKVWRGERPQEGRYREFTQADIDVVSRDVLAFHHDVEVARVMAEALGGLTFLPALRLQINNRKLIEGFYLGVGAAEVASVMRVIDKIDKLPREVISAMLADEAGLSDDQAKLCLGLAEIRTVDSSFVDRVRALGVSHQLLEEGLSELAAVIDGCAAMNTDRFAVEADLSIARGLDYYTGTVFETRMIGYESLGSICSGGRYDSLASDGRTTYPGVGISLGLTRLLMPLFIRKKLASSRSVPSVVLVALPDESTRSRCEEIAQGLRSRGIATEVSPTPQKYGKQIRFAERRGIPFVWFPGDTAATPDTAADDVPETGTATGADAVAAPDQVKDIRSGDQCEADAASWRPPPEDLRPQILQIETA